MQISSTSIQSACSLSGKQMDPTTYQQFRWTFICTVRAAKPLYRNNCLYKKNISTHWRWQPVHYLHVATCWHWQAENCPWMEFSSLSMCWQVVDRYHDDLIWRMKFWPHVMTCNFYYLEVSIDKIEEKNSRTEYQELSGTRVWFQIKYEHFHFSSALLSFWICQFRSSTARYMHLKFRIIWTWWNK